MPHRRRLRRRCRRRIRRSQWRELFERGSPHPGRDDSVELKKRPAGAELFYWALPHQPWAPPLPGPVTRSLPLARPSRASAFGGFLSPIPNRLKSPTSWRRGRSFVTHLDCLPFGDSIPSWNVSHFFRGTLKTIFERPEIVFAFLTASRLKLPACVVVFRRISASPALNG